MEPSRKLIDSLRREKIKQAQEMTFAQRFLAGAELFDCACQITSAGIKMQNPTFTEEQILAELRRRIERSDRRKEAR